MPAITIIPSEPMTIVAVPGYVPDTTVVEWPRERGQDPTTYLWTTTRRLEGIEKALVTIADTLAGLKRITHREGPFFVLTVEVPGSLSATGVAPSANSQTRTKWGLQASRLEKDLWLFPPVKLAMMDALPDAEKRSRFRADFEALIAGSVTFNKAPAGDLTTPSKPLPDFALTFGNLIKYYGISTVRVNGISHADVLTALLQSRGLGTSAFVVPGVVLVKTTTALVEATNAPVDFSNYGQLFTTNGLLRREPTIYPTIRAALLRDAAMRAGFWFKEMPTLDDQDETRLIVRSMWTFADDYDRFVFDTPLN